MDEGYEAAAARLSSLPLLLALLSADGRELVSVPAETVSTEDTLRDLAARNGAADGERVSWYLLALEDAPPGGLSRYQAGDTLASGSVTAQAKPQRSAVSRFVGGLPFFLAAVGPVLVVSAASLALVGFAARGGYRATKKALS